jgi:predicted dehydrogenase
MSKIRWAILGAGRIAHKFAQDIRFAENAELVGIAASDKERAAAFAAQYQLPLVFSYEELYNSDKVDAVYIATTHNFHFEQSMECMKHGKAVLCEKPVTINVAQFKLLVNTSVERNVFLMEALWTFYLPALQKARQWIDEGRIGAVRLIQADFGFQMEFNPSGRLYNRELAGGSLLDLGIYPIAFSYFFMGRKPVNITASGRIGSTGVDETTAMILDYGDITASLYCCMVVKTRNTGYIFGDKGYIELPDFYKASMASLYNPEKELQETYHDNRRSFGYHYEIQDATNALLSGKKESEIATHQVSVDLQEIMTEIRRQIGLKYPGE